MENFQNEKEGIFKRGEGIERLLKPKYDVVFHALFKEGNENITKAMISAITNEEIKDIKIDNDRHIFGRYPEEKIGIVDLKAKLDNGTICDIEVQLADNKDTAERFLFYWSRIFSAQLLRGEKYQELNKVIGIIIIDYSFDKTKEIESISTKWKVKEVSAGKNIELTDVLELYIIEIPKARKMLEKEPNNSLAQWGTFINNPNEKEVLDIMKTSKEIQEAMDALEKISEDKELRRIIELKQKAIWDENSKKAREEEERQKFIEENEKAKIKIKKEATEEGRKEGIEEGIKQVAKEMKIKNVPIEAIQEVTNLTKEEINEL